MRSLVFVLLALGAAVGPAQAGDKAARRLGTQWVTTYAFLDHLRTAQTRSPHLPAHGPLFQSVSQDRKSGTTVQNPWPGDGENRWLHVRVKKVDVPLIQHDLWDCLVVPLPGRVGFDVDVFPGSAVVFAPAFIGGGAGRLRLLVDGKPVWEKIEPTRSLWRNNWEEVKVPLTAFAGKRVKIAFEVDRESLGADRWDRRRTSKPSVALFGLPRVLTRLQASDTAGRKAVAARIGDEMNSNVIMFVFDSGRADLLPPVRDERKIIPSITPNLDRFAAKAVRFSRAFSVGNQTRVGSYSMYTATPPSAGGFWSARWTLNDDFRKTFYGAGRVTLPQLLHKHGYLAGHMGYNGFLHAYLYLALDMGFDFVTEYNGVPQNTVNMTTGINAWLEKHKDEKFFLLVWFDPPHFPYGAPREYREQIYRAGVKRDLDFFDHGFLAKMAYGDDYFGRIWKKIEQLGLDKKTLFVVTADHGEAMDPRHAGHSDNVNTRTTRHHGKTFFDEEIQVPLLFRWDGELAAGKDIPAQVSLVSLAPTISGLLGHPTNHPSQWGRSFETLVRGGTEKEERLIYFEGRWSYGIRTSEYKYIYHDTTERLRFNRKEMWQRGRDGTDELLHVAKDPFETANLAKAQADVLARMKTLYRGVRKRLRAFRSRTLTGAAPRPIEALSAK